jgi:hypothetical protein
MPLDKIKHVLHEGGITPFVLFLTLGFRRGNRSEDKQGAKNNRWYYPEKRRGDPPPGGII